MDGPVSGVDGDDDMQLAELDETQFEMLELLGRGSFGRVFRALDKRRGAQSVALKVVDLANEDCDLAAVEREIRVGNGAFGFFFLLFLFFLRLW